MIDDYIWIRSDEELRQVSQIWAGSNVLAIDTEFVRTETFHAYLGLIQVALREKTWLIDPLDIVDWKPFADILLSEQIVKVFHSLSEDAEVLNHSVGVLINNAFDTQIAAGFLGHPIQMSYAKMVEELFDVVLPKEATRSDWLKRPLETEQCSYAAADVHWLFQVYEIFSAQLIKDNRYAWVCEDTQRVVLNNLPVEPEFYYLKLRGGWKLKGSRLQALKDLAMWREKLARASNCNRGRILQDKDLIAIAEKMPTSKSVLQQSLNLPSRKIRLYGDQIIQMIKEAESTKREDWPQTIDGPLPADQANLLRTIRERITALAEEHSVPAELLARRKLLESWLRSGCHSGQYIMPEPFSGWRKTILMQPITEILMTQWEDLHET